MEESQRKAVLSRRSALKVLAAGSGALVSGCWGTGGEGDERLDPVSIGPASSLAEGETAFSVHRILVRRTGGRVSALSLVCPHQRCLVGRSPAGFHCPCHGSLFSPSGEVLKGPATGAMATLRIDRAENGDLRVHPGEKMPTGWSYDLSASAMA